MKNFELTTTAKELRDALRTAGGSDVVSFDTTDTQVNASSTSHSTLLPGTLRELSGRTSKICTVPAEWIRLVVDSLDDMDSDKTVIFYHEFNVLGVSKKGSTSEIEVVLQDMPPGNNMTGQFLIPSWKLYAQLEFIIQMALSSDPTILMRADSKNQTVQFYQEAIHVGVDAKVESSCQARISKMGLQGVLDNFSFSTNTLVEVNPGTITFYNRDNSSITAF